MKRYTRSCLTFLVLFSILLTSCRQLSEKVTDPSAGLNGSFEVSQNGIPVNWLLYTPNTVPNADFKIVLDTIIYKEGKQSLKFDITSCRADGGWNSPGFTNEFFDIGKYEGPAKYQISFWIRNHGTRFKFSAGGVSAKTGNMITFIDTDSKIENWQQFSYEVDVPKEQWLRVQLNLLQPGSFWIDDFSVKKL
ncbi:hypothetical protein [Mangrovimonas xylaniphaga]|uniref:hypothetical protein n=1 Tax=Mangrovimonas xylaniphaga TaxID=1645915 RepID=UPI000A64CE8E|nr:hypothetical protein [Mangrovimonas xylaniphaga]